MAAATPESLFKNLSTDIRRGQYDGHLVQLTDVIREHVASSDDIAVKWKLQVGDLTVTEDDLSFPEAVEWENRSQVSWLMLSPAGSAAICKALLVTVLISRKGMSEDEAEAHLNTWTHAQIVGALTLYEVDQTPLEQRQL